MRASATSATTGTRTEPQPKPRASAARDSVPKVCSLSPARHDGCGRASKGSGLIPSRSTEDTMNATAQHRIETQPIRLAYSVQEAAQMLGVCDKSVRRLIRPSRALRHILIPRDEIERFLRDTR